MKNIIVIESADRELAAKTGRIISARKGIPFYLDEIERKTALECNVEPSELYLEQSRAVTDMFAIVEIMLMKKGPCVILGGAAAYILGSYENVLTVCLASKKVTDVKYDRFVRKYTGCEINRYKGYSLAAHADEISAEEAADFICDFAK